MATMTIEDMGYVVLREENGYQHLQKKGAVSTPGIEGYLVRRKPKPDECQLNTSLLGAECSRQDRDCVLCIAQAEHERQDRAESFKQELETEGQRLDAIASEPLPEGQVRVWHSLTRLCGCSGMTIGQVRGSSIYVKIYPEDKSSYRLDKARFDKGDTQVRGSWCFEKFEGRKQAAESIQDQNWQD